jgi:hypothetical protein
MSAANENEVKKTTVKNKKKNRLSQTIARIVF